MSEQQDRKSDCRLFQPEWASLRMLTVLPQYRGQGIGQQLSLACIHRAKQDRAEAIALLAFFRSKRDLLWGEGVKPLLFPKRKALYIRVN